MSTEPVVNIPLLRKAVEWVEEQAALPKPERHWNQQAWYLETDCGTVYCVCGKLAVETGAQITTECHTEGCGCQWIEFDGLAPEDFGANALGINSNQAEALFDEWNTAADVRRIAEEIAGERL